ncbi:ABC transporter ATP-binding protein [bacterium]|nr:ABC transporter ATP-binding protein [bacterium]
MIEIKNLAWQINDKPILRRFSATIPSGAVTTIIGPNGAGKTSLARSILRLIDEWTGSISLDGTDIRTLTSQELARHISYVPQDIPLSQSMSVEEFVSLSRYPWLNNWQPLSSRDRDVVNNSLEKAGILALKERVVASLSGGERQMAAIAAALAQETPLIIMDEPASNLDPFHSHQLYQLAKDISQHDNKSVLIVTHDITAAVRYSDSIILLKEGKLFFEGTPQSVANSSLLEQLFGISFSVLTDDSGNIMVFPGGKKSE